MSQWTQEQAVALCRLIEAVCPTHGCHVALTGGLLYKDGPRKDADILFYRIRQFDEIDINGLLRALKTIGIKITRLCGWVVKAEYRDLKIDLFFPENDSGDYDRDESAPTSVSDVLANSTESI